MREFVFTFTYEPGDNPIADVLTASPETQFRSLSCHVIPETLWARRERTRHSKRRTLHF